LIEERIEKFSAMGVYIEEGNESTMH